MLEVKSQKLEVGSEKTELDQEIIEHRVSIDQLRYEHRHPYPSIKLL
ncbi:MAG: hypothetical protein MUO91_08320 [candidate division Zixibacteria bacterium]|nr:hypothetical protein [candidate division Zixibacteria bacterium]